MKKKIEIDIDFLRRPIFASNTITGELFTGIKVIDTNEKIKEINIRIGDMWDNYYEFDSHNQGCWFNEEQFKKDRSQILSLLKELIDELNRMNDGSYEIEDRATEYITTFSL